MKKDAQQKPNNFERLRASTLLQKRLAKYIVRFCFRDDTILEQLHADPDSRISDEEMRELMVAAVQNCYAVIGFLVNSRDARPGLIPMVGHAAVHMVGITGEPNQPVMDFLKDLNLLDVLEVCDFNPGWDDPKDSAEE